MNKIIDLDLIKDKVSEQVMHKLELLIDYDLSFLTNNFTDEHHQQGRPYANEQIYPIVKHFGKADLQIAKSLEIEFKRFVAITIMNPGIVHAPSGPVDMYWHYFILHTAPYRRFCEKIWGAHI